MTHHRAPVLPSRATNHDDLLRGSPSGSDHGSDRRGQAPRFRLGGPWLSVVTFVLSTALPALIVGWRISLGIAVLILIHEMGHWLMARHLGLHPELPVLIPFLGGFVLTDAESANDWERALVALAGPATGTLGSVLFTLGGFLVNSGTLVTLGTVGLILNLLNLLPVLPFDGGWSAAAIDRRLWLLGFAGVVVIVWGGLVEWWILPFIALGALQMYFLRWERNSDEVPSRRSTPLQRVVIGGIHIATIMLPVVFISVLLPTVWGQIHGA